MKINSVFAKTVIVINGVEFVRNIEDWTQSIKDAKKDGISFVHTRDIFNWIEFEEVD